MQEAETAIVEQEPTHLVAAASTAVTPLDMLNRAVEDGAGVEVMEKLMGLHERWEANAARKAFDEAMAAAKADIPTISKNREVDFTSSKGRTNYRHEDLGEIANVVTPILAEHGLSYRFRTTSQLNEPVTVTCIVSHRDGYSEENTLSAGKDDTGNKNSIQAVGSTITYLQRYTLKAALGLAVSNDDDAAKSDGSMAPISAEQLERMRTLLDESGADIPAFCRMCKIEKLDELPAVKFDNAMQKIKEKAARQTQPKEGQE